MTAPVSGVRAALLELRGALTGLAVLTTGFLGLSFADISNVVSGYIGSFHPHLSALLLVISILLGTLGATLRSRLGIAASLAFGAIVAIQIVSVQSTSVPARQSDVLTVSSFNILGTNYRNGERIADMVASSTSDVFVVLEAAPIERFLQRITANYPYRAGCDTQTCDLVVFSKLPLISAQILTAGKTFQRRVIRLQMKKQDTAFTFVAAHITKPYLDERGEEEINWLAHLVGQQRGPLVVAGDFNQASWSPLLNAFLRETKLGTARGEPATFPPPLGNWGLPIDHILVRDAAISTIEAMSDNMGSNHRGLQATIALGVASEQQSSASSDSPREEPNP